jgi:hypothetical protein
VKWRKLGLVWEPDGSQAWARTHAMLPTPVLRDDGTIRVYVTCCDDKFVGRPSYVDVSADDPCRVLRVARDPLLDVGQPGAFDDNGVAALAIVPAGERRCYMYYVGFELGTRIRYRLLTGLAVSDDAGNTFRRLRATPILERSPAELYFRCGNCVLREGGGYRMWYVAGSEWTEVNGKAMPVYVIKHLASSDGMRWGDEGQVCLDLSDPDEHGFGRPWVVRTETGYHMYFSVRRRSLAAYRLGFATSPDGLHWTRDDAALGLGVSASGWDAEAIMYSAVLRTCAGTYLFYNGSNFGEHGFGVALQEAG